MHTLGFPGSLDNGSWRWRDWQGLWLLLLRVAGPQGRRSRRSSRSGRFQFIVRVAFFVNRDERVLADDLGALAKATILLVHGHEFSDRKGESGVLWEVSRSVSAVCSGCGNEMDLGRHKGVDGNGAL